MFLYSLPPVGLFGDVAPDFTKGWGVQGMIRDGIGMFQMLTALGEGLGTFYIKVQEGNVDWLAVLEAFSPAMATIVKRDFMNQEVEQDVYCEAMGRLAGGVAFEIAMTLATAGVGAAIKAVKCSKLVVGAVAKLDNVAPNNSIIRWLKRNTGCFVAGTLVWTAAGAVPIEEVPLGALMLTDADAAQHEVLAETDAADRTLHVLMDLAEPDGDRFTLESMVSPEEFAAMSGLASELLSGGPVFFADFETEGRPLSVEVLGTSNLLTDGQPRVAMLSEREGITQKIELKITGYPHPLVTTVEHPFWSEDRGTWVRAGSLTVGERLRSDVAGAVSIEALSRVYDDRPVYNIEVTQHHNYYVGEAAVLVHNENICNIDVVRRKDMDVEYLYDTPIYGQSGSSSLTRGHAEAMEELAIKLALDPDTDYVVIQRSWRTTTGRASPSRKIPDVMRVKKDGTVDAFEIASDTDIFSELNKRLEGGLNSLPPENRGKIEILDVIEVLGQ